MRSYQRVLLSLSLSLSLRLLGLSTPTPDWGMSTPYVGQLEKEEKRRKNMAKARRFDASFQKELELRRQERLEEEQGER